MPRRLKVLMSAYACEPNKGSEPAVGWNWMLQMSRWHDLWVLTRANNRPGIESVRLPETEGRVNWVYFDLPRWGRFWKRGFMGTQAYYYLWQRAVRKVGARLHGEVGFDLLHHVTFGKYWVPSHLARLPIKSILGPVGGGESTPAALTGALSGSGLWYERGRDAARSLAGLDPVLRSTLKRAALVAATTEESKRTISRAGAPRVVVEPQFGMNEEELAFFAKFPPGTGKPFRLISIGRLLQWKGFHLGLQAFARFLEVYPESEYWIINDGPRAAALRQLVAELGITSKVTFWGKLPRLSDVYDKLAQADVLVHPALHEAFGNVCLEALAAGRPVICLDTGGPALQVSSECGFKAPVDSLERALSAMTEAMVLLAKDPELRRRMGQAARDRVRNEFQWQRKGERMNVFYQEAAGKS